MFVDFNRAWPPPAWGPPPSRPALSKRNEKILVWAISFNLLMLVLSPIAGATLFDALVAYLAR